MKTRSWLYIAVQALVLSSVTAAETAPSLYKRADAPVAARAMICSPG